MPVLGRMCGRPTTTHARCIAEAHLRQRVQSEPASHGHHHRQCRHHLRSHPALPPALAPKALAAGCWRLPAKVCVLVTGRRGVAAVQLPRAWPRLARWARLLPGKQPLMR
eukprot:349770-Chlamydomonas_euryale.AAC.1